MQHNLDSNNNNLLYIHAGAELYGADRILLELVNGMNEHNWKPLVILPNEGPLVAEFEKLGIEVQVLPFPVLRRKYFTVTGIYSYFSQLFIYIKKIKQIIKAKNINLIHSNTLAVLPGLFAAKQAKIPHVWHVHEIIIKPAFLNKLLSNLASLYSDKIVTVSNAVKKHLANGQPKLLAKTDVIYNGIDTNKFSPSEQQYLGQTKIGLDSNIKIFGMIGRINRWKGQLFLLEAAEEVLNQVEDSHCLFVGGVFENETFYKEKLLEEIKLKGLEKRVTVLDFQPDPENVHRYFDVFILPSIEPDPLPTVVLEAMSSGVPVVANGHGGAVEMVKNEETGFLIKINEKEDLANKITYLLRNPLEAKRMGENGRKRAVQYFSKRRFFEEFSQLYRTIIKKED